MFSGSASIIRVLCAPYFFAQIWTNKCAMYVSTYSIFFCFGIFVRLTVKFTYVGKEKQIKFTQLIPLFLSIAKLIFSFLYLGFTTAYDG